MKVKIIYSNEQEKYPFSLTLKRIIKKAVKGALEYMSFPYNAEVSLTLTDNEGIRSLNSQHRNIDKATDVLSFPMYDFKGGEKPFEDPAEIGDIVLSLERAEEQAEQFGHSFRREVAFLTVHSVLHLLGYDHETGEDDEREMFALQDKIMEKIGISRD